MLFNPVPEGILKHADREKKVLQVNSTDWNS